MSTPSYESPPVHRVALENRLRHVCDALDLNELRTRTSLGTTRSSLRCCRAGVGKGRAAIKFRTSGHASRVTRDLDATRAADHTVETMQPSCRNGWPRVGTVLRAGSSMGLLHGR